MVNTPHGLSAKALTTTMPKPGQGDDQDQQHGNHGHHARKGADFGAGDFRQRMAFMPNRADQNREILHATGEHRADQQPDQSWRKTELGGKRWAHQRTGTGNGGEVMTEQHPFRRRHIVVVVFIQVSRRYSTIVQGHDLGREKRAVEAVSQGVET